MYMIEGCIFKDLKSSERLNEEMKKLAESHVSTVTTLTSYVYRERTSAVILCFHILLRLWSLKNAKKKTNLRYSH